MMHKKTIFSGLVLTALSFSSCTEYSLMDDNAIRLGLFGEEYSENFENAYGKIAPDQTWDFSTINLRNLGLYGGPSSSTAATRAAYTGSVSATPASGIIKAEKTEGVGISSYGDYYAVEQSTLNWLNTNLPEGKQTPLNVTKGNPFVLGTPTNDFAIIPIYQGHAGMCWDLHLVDKTTNNDYTIWSKSDGIKHELNYAKEHGEEYNYSMKEKSEGGNTGYWGDGEGNSGVERIYFNNAFNGVESRNTSGDDYVQVWFQLPAGATIKGYFEKDNGEQQWGYNDGSYTTLGDAGSTSEQWVRYDLVNGDTKWNNGNFAELTWHNQGTVNCEFSDWKNNRVRIYTRYNYQTTKYLDSPKDVTNLTGNTVNRTGVGAKPILIDHTKIGGDFFLYLKITQQDPDNPAYAAAGACQRSDEGMMVALPLTRPSNIASDKEYMIIGCEDSNTEISDWDVNDICFLIVGQGTLPKVKEVVAKRYMIEDLGSTYDFDFNDIVVDVTQTIQKNYDGTEYSKVQTAEIKWLCGTIPFQLKIGDTTFDRLEGHVSTYPSTVYEMEKYKKTITGWDPKNNNITVTVWPKAAGWTDDGKSGFLGEKDSQTFGFPENGEFPYIIACDQTVNWMAEQVSVPRSWFNTWPANYDKWQNHGQDTPGGDDTPNYGTEINYTTDGTYGLHVNIGQILRDKSSVTLTFVPQGETTFNLSGNIGGSYQNGEEWPWVDTTSYFSNVSSAVEVTINGLSDLTSHGVGTDYDAKISLWDSKINGVDLTQSNITEYFKPENIKVYYK